MVTLRRGPVEFIEQVRKHYRQDFRKFAKTGSFLIYEYWDALVDSYKKAMRAFEGHAERVQGKIFETEDDAIFTEVSDVTRDLLSFRKTMLAAREVLNELSSRRSPFVSESTQPFLERMVGTLERLSADLSVERDILAETLNLYMGIISHRTNKVVSRLTVVSMVFLPLTFLVRRVRHELRHRRQHARAAVAARLPRVLGHRPDHGRRAAVVHEAEEVVVRPRASPVTADRVCEQSWGVCQ